ncbi:cryptochrome/photolyase family protein [Ideonella livida]|uniref:Deoxyribodipyrimidine photo-lyase n=1 Tax=Ideonella livida TaxID=2707176 RepID=A0A7C9TLL8_9BURK|nr:deoxyribodipyrimidine photo-lyase [Ideonella livida]NDY93258.1 deoxyribodipyrimidine photo-lyase [Ideonella livida]
MSSLLDRALVWCRRDLRLEDHSALAAACSRSRQVWMVFVLDTDILDLLPRQDRRVEFIRESLVDLDGQLQRAGREAGSPDVRLIVRHGPARQEVPALAALLDVQAVFAAHDDEPDALARDGAVSQTLARRGVAWHSVKDHVVFERREVMTGSGGPYGVFTPYKNAWLKRLQAEPQALESRAARHAALAAWPATLLGSPRVPTLADIGFETTDLAQLRLPTGSQGAAQLLADFLPRLARYDQTRDFPAVKGPSYLSTHLRFGTVSIRQLARSAWPLAQAGSSGASTWLSELIWRDFYHQLLHHHPRVATHCYKPEFDALRWDEGPEAERLLQAWCEGRTGYPLVDAAMRQLRQTGYMHNRLRMVTASFLTKDLGVDWRRGEAWFARWLNDFDLAANNGGWQWAASTGCDAQPWFRIFNPVTQSQKFDPQGRFIRRYVPELAGLDERSLHAPWTAPAGLLSAAGVALGRDYPAPVVDHAQARERTLQRFKALDAAGAVPPA